jgi:type III restriction enzyme
MSDPFFDHPILNSPYAYPARHWELDEAGQPTQKVIEHRRSAKFITPIPKPKKRKAAKQSAFVFDEGKGISTQEQQYDPTSVINEVRGHVDAWRSLPNANQWQVTPETARLLQHWRHHNFNSVRPFFCQIEAAETAIWLTEVAPQSRNGKRLLDHLASANHWAPMTRLDHMGLIWMLDEDEHVVARSDGEASLSSGLTYYRKRQWEHHMKKLEKTP